MENINGGVLIGIVAIILFVAGLFIYNALYPIKVRFVVISCDHNLYEEWLQKINDMLDDPHEQKPLDGYRLMELLRPIMSERDALHLLAEATEDNPDQISFGEKHYGRRK